MCLIISHKIILIDESSLEYMLNIQIIFFSSEPDMDNHFYFYDVDDYFFQYQFRSKSQLLMYVEYVFDHLIISHKIRLLDESSLDWKQS